MISTLYVLFIIQHTKQSQLITILPNSLFTYLIYILVGKRLAISILEHFSFNCPALLLDVEVEMCSEALAFQRILQHSKS